MGLRILCAIALICSLCIANAKAGIIVEVGDASISAGGTGYVDVLVSSDGSDVLDSFSILAEISGSASNGSLIFDSTTIDVVGESNYVFSSDPSSGGQIIFVDADPPAFSTQVSVSDSTETFSGVTLNSSTKLLARLALSHSTVTASAAVGDTFTITLINTTGSSIDTQFFDIGGSPIAISTNNVGTVTITAAAVPEPSSFLVLLTLGTAVGIRRGRRQTS